MQIKADILSHNGVYCENLQLEMVLKWKKNGPSVKRGHVQSCLTMFQVNSTRGRASKKASLIFFPSRSGKTVARPEPTLCTTMS